MTTPLPVDVWMPSVDIPCEYRLVQISSGKFLGVGDGSSPVLVDKWEVAMYFSSTNHHQGNVEGTLEYQWKWLLEECGEEWMKDANMNDYRVHVLIGESEC